MTPITEQLDALVLNNEELLSWAGHGTAATRTITIQFNNRSVVQGVAPTLAAAAELATLHAMKAIHEGRDDG